MSSNMSTDHRASFSRSGFVAPIPLLTKQQAFFLGRHLLTARPRLPVWDKSLATVDPLVHQTATHPELLRLLRDLIGDDIILWGASVIVRRPGEIHPWHCDMESCGAGDGFVSVWMGLMNAQKESALLLIPGSHSYGASIQELAVQEGLSRGERTDEVTLRLANARSPGASIVQPAVGDGDAIVFDGRLWHGTENALSDRPRVALLLQYARSDRQIKVPDFRNFEWPFQFKDDARPPVIVVSGRGDENSHALVPAPSPRLKKAIGSCAHPIDPNASCADGVSFTPVHCFIGHTRNVDYLECHYSILMPGNSPHPPHAHLDEEILVVMSGEGELVVADAVDDPSPSIIPVQAGSAIYYPPYQHHTIRNASSAPVRYAMLRWRSSVISAAKHLPPHFAPSSWLEADTLRGPVAMKNLFEGPSAYLGKLNAHVTRIEPGGGYEAHRDAHDVSIFLIEGKITVLGKEIVAPAVVFFPGGDLHDMVAAGDQPAKYIVWEFHRTARRQLRREASEPAVLAN